MIEEKLNDVKNLLSDNKTKEAFELSEDIFWNSNLQNDLIIIKSKFLDIHNHYALRNELSIGEYQTQKSIITKQLLELIEAVDSKDFMSNLTRSSDDLQSLGLKRITNILFNKVKRIYDGDAEITGVKNALTMYVDALDNVENRFLTTSYIDSHFWVYGGDDIAIVGANEKLVERIEKTNKDLSDCLQRLFLVPSDIEGYITNRVDIAVSKLKQGDKTDYDNLSIVFRKLNSMANKVNMKVIDINYLPPPIKSNNGNFFNPKEGDKEIALYDNFRLDIFNLDPNKRIDSIRMISNRFENFDTITQRISNYFQDSWNHEKCMNIEDFLEILKDELDYQTLSKVDYDAEWLIAYDHLLRSNNHILGSEKSSLLGYLEKTKKHYRNHLDIGVCTGRYPEELKNKELVNNSYSIDLDSDVAEWMAKFRKDVPFLRWDIRLPSVIEKLKSSFNISKYDLITCMVSTISHFNKIDKFKKFDYETGLIKGVENIGYLLNEGGIMVISTWNNFDILRNKEFDLYDDKAIDYLEKHTPTIDEIMNVLNRKNKNFVFDKQLDNDKFNIYIIRKQTK